MNKSTENALAHAKLFFTLLHTDRVEKMLSVNEETIDIPETEFPSKEIFGWVMSLCGENYYNAKPRVIQTAYVHSQEGSCASIRLINIQRRVDRLRSEMTILDAECEKCTSEKKLEKLCKKLHQKGEELEHYFRLLTH